MDSLRQEAVRMPSPVSTASCPAVMRRPRRYHHTSKNTVNNSVQVDQVERNGCILCRITGGSKNGMYSSANHPRAGGCASRSRARVSAAARKQPTTPAISNVWISTMPPGSGMNIRQRIKTALVRKCCQELGSSVRASRSTSRSSLPQHPGQTMTRTISVRIRYGSIHWSQRRVNGSLRRMLRTSVTAPCTTAKASSKNSPL